MTTGPFYTSLYGDSAQASLKYPYKSNCSSPPRLGRVAPKATGGSYYSCKSEMRQKANDKASPRGSWLRSRLKGQGMKSPAAFGRHCPLTDFVGVLPRESLPAYRYSHLHRVPFINHPYMYRLPNPALVSFAHFRLEPA